MKRTSSTWTAILGSIFLVAGCGGSDAKQDASDATTATTAAATKQEPTRERLLERSRERVGAQCKGDWIAVYNYIHPKAKEWMTIYQFLEGKDMHEYNQPTEPEVIALDGDTAYLSVTALWTPKHPMLKHVDNVPEGWDPTERIEWIETWQFTDGDWYMQWPQEYPADFYEQHPELLKKKPAEEQVAKAPAEDTENR
jgi:hypothetical protein